MNKTSESVRINKNKTVYSSNLKGIIYEENELLFQNDLNRINQHASNSKTQPISRARSIPSSHEITNDIYN